MAKHQSIGTGLKRTKFFKKKATFCDGGFRLQMKKRIIITQKNESEILQALNTFSNRKKVRKSRDGRKYYVFKSTKDKWLRTALSYYFVCSIYDCNSARIIEHQVEPALSTILLFIFFPATMINVLYHFISQQSVSELYFFISFFANLFLLIIDRQTKRSYIREFEGLFEAEQKGPVGQTNY